VDRKPNELGGRPLVRRYAASIGAAMAAALVVWMASRIPNADWYGIFDAAGRGVLQGRSPYEQPLFANPPWTVALLLPFVVFPPATARGLVLVRSAACLLYVGRRIGARKLASARSRHPGLSALISCVG